MQIKNKKPLNFFQKLFKKPSYYNIYVEVFNSVVSKGSENIKSDDIVNILHENKLSDAKNMTLYFYKIYAEFLLKYLKDLKLSDEEKRKLINLKNALGLNDKHVDEIIRGFGEKIYSKKIDDVLFDARITDEEKKELENLKKDLKISDSLADKIYTKKAKKLYESKLDDAISDQRLSPEEEKELKELADSLGLDPKMSNTTKQLLDKYKTLWFIENGELPVQKVSIHLKRGENCYFIQDYVDYYETRKVRRRLRYSGPTARIKIVKGIYWRAGDLAYNMAADDEWRKLDNGMLYFTNKRVIFYGANSVKTVKLDSILDLKNVLGGGFIIMKDRGKDPMFKGNFDTDIVLALFSRLFKNDN